MTELADDRRAPAGFGSAHCHGTCGIGDAQEAHHVPATGRFGTACASCVPQLSSEAERVAALRAAVSVETEPVVTLTHLLRLCRDEHAVLWELVADPECQARTTNSDPSAP